MFQKFGGKIIGFAHYLEVTQKDEVNLNSNHWIQILVFLSIRIAQQRQNSWFLMTVIKLIELKKK